MRKEDYLKIVKRCKFLVESIECYQLEIAYHAFNVCDIKHGGKSAGLYTITRFAKDIGLNKKTVSMWVNIYKNIILKLDKDFYSLTRKDWEVASKVDDRIRQEIRAFNLINKTIGKKNNSRFYDKNKVKDLFGVIYDKGDFEAQLLSFNRYLIHTKKQLLSKDLSGINKATLASISESCREINDYIITRFAFESRINDDIYNEIGQ